MLRYALAATAVAVLVGCTGSADEKATVVQECKDSVQAHLNYNADFPFLDPNPVKTLGVWHLNGTVTAQNGFGAKRTLYWTCTIDSQDNVTTTVG